MVLHHELNGRENDCMNLIPNILESHEDQCKGLFQIISDMAPGFYSSSSGI